MNLIETADFLRMQDHFVLLTHKNPDGDTVGSAVALCLALRELGKTAYVLENPGFTARFMPFLDGLITSDTDGCLLSIDVADSALLPDNSKAVSDRIALAVDHHETHRAFAPRLLVDGNAAACGELILELIDSLNVSLTEKIAQALYLAIATDTGCFSFSNTSVRTHLAAARLFPYIPNVAAINHTFCVEKSRKRVALEAHLLCNVEYYFDNACALLTITQELMQKLDLCDDDLDNIASIARAIQGVELAVVVRELKCGDCKVSLRSDMKVDSAYLCSLFGGGGHRCASGCTISASPEDAKAQLIAKIKESEVFPL